MTARRTVALALSLLAGGACSSAPRPAQAPGPALPEARHETSWTSVAVPAGGLTVDFPGSPEEVAGWSQGETPVFYRGLVLEQGQTTMTAAAYVVEKRTAADAQALTGMRGNLKKILKVSPVELEGYRGEELDGEAEGKVQKVRNFVVGNTFFVLTVQSTTRVVDPAIARRFFDSARFTMPWKVEPIPALGLSVALPALAFPVEGKNPAVLLFALAGIRDEAYVVSASPIAPELQQSPDELFDRVQDEYRKTGQITLSVGIQVGGLPGREVFLDTKEGHCRARLYAEPERLVQLMFTSADKKRLSSPDARRFLESATLFD